MNSQNTTEPSANASQLAEVLDQFLVALEAGNAPTREELLAEYPELADELSDCLTSLEMICRAEVDPRPDGRDESLLHQPLDHRTDIYSLGITLYELLTLTPAFAGSARQQLMRRILEEEPRAPRQLSKAIPKDLETITLKATAKEPQCRYATAAELAGDLRRFLADQPIQARRRSRVERAVRWTRRHRAIVGSALAVVTIAVAALSTSTFFIARAHQASEANLQMTCDAVEKLLGRLERFVEGKARGSELHAVRELVQYATELEEKLPETVREKVDHQARMASMYYNYGRCAAWHHENDLARTSLQTARDVYQHLARDHPADYRLELGLVHYALAEVARNMGQPSSAEGSYRKSMQFFKPLRGGELPKSLLSQDPKEIKASCDRAIASGPETHYIVNGDPDSPTASGELGGFVWQFTFVPEPSTFVLLAFGLLVLVGYAQRR